MRRSPHPPRGLGSRCPHPPSLIALRNLPAGDPTAAPPRTLLTSIGLRGEPRFAAFRTFPFGDPTAIPERTRARVLTPTAAAAPPPLALPASPSLSSRHPAQSTRPPLWRQLCPTSPCPPPAYAPLAPPPAALRPHALPPPARASPPFHPPSSASPAAPAIAAAAGHHSHDVGKPAIQTR